MKDALDLFASCAPGIEPVLEAELRERGFDVQRAEAGGIAFKGDRREMMRANLELGTALQVLWRVERFNAHDFKELHKRLARMPWAELLPADAPRRVRAFAKKSRLYHTGALCERVEQVLVEKLGPAIESDTPPITVALRMDRDRATIAIDTSGESLHRRGYRRDPGQAPLREDIACALLRVAGYTGKQPLFDPMTGAGTLAIEAARIRDGGLAVRRRFAFEQLPGHDADLLEDLRPAPSPRAGSLPIVARDRDTRAVARARANAAIAGVEAAILWETGSLGNASAIDGLARGAERPLLVVNPPYGKRLGEAKKLLRLYAAIGRRAQSLGTSEPSNLDGTGEAGNSHGAGARLALVTSSTRLASRTAVNLESKLLTDLGGLKVRLYVGDAARAEDMPAAQTTHAAADAEDTPRAPPREPENPDD